VNQVILKQGNVQLNFGFGTLHLRKGSQVEFKSSAQTEPSSHNLLEKQDRIPHSKEFDDQTNAIQNESQAADEAKKIGASCAERTISNIQRRQSTAPRTLSETRPAEKRLIISPI
jgi:hypothetical protein